MATKAKSTTEINAKVDRVMDALENYIDIMIDDNKEVSIPLNVKPHRDELKAALKDILYGV